MPCEQPRPKILQLTVLKKKASQLKLKLDFDGQEKCCGFYDRLQVRLISKCLIAEILERFLKWL